MRSLERFLLRIRDQVQGSQFFAGAPTPSRFLERFRLLVDRRCLR